MLRRPLPHCAAADGLSPWPLAAPRRTRASAGRLAPEKPLWRFDFAGFDPRGVEVERAGDQVPGFHCREWAHPWTASAPRNPA
jgi:hypothetical protein